MGSRVCKLLLFAVLLSVYPQMADAQLYRRGDSIRNVIRSVSGKDGLLERSDAKRSSNKKSKKKSASSKKHKANRIDSIAYVPKYRLGDRVIMRGDSGADVREVARILVLNLFIDEKDVPYTKSGMVLFDGELVKALKLFQKAEGMYDDGLISTPTIKALRKRNSAKR